MGRVKEPSRWRDGLAGSAAITNAAGASDCRWERASQATAERQQKLEESANQLASFQAAEAQLRPWLMEKELMMSVLGPLSIDPNMLNAQKQQVQVSLEWCRHLHGGFRTRRGRVFHPECEVADCTQSYLSCKCSATQRALGDLLAPLPSPPNPAECKLL